MSVELSLIISIVNELEKFNNDDGKENTCIENSVSLLTFEEMVTTSKKSTKAFKRIGNARSSNFKSNMVLMVNQFLPHQSLKQFKLDVRLY